jgi:hypothetical protein
VVEHEAGVVEVPFFNLLIPARVIRNAVRDEVGGGSRIALDCSGARSAAPLELAKDGVRRSDLYVIHRF